MVKAICILTIIAVVVLIWTGKQKGKLPEPAEYHSRNYGKRTKRRRKRPKGQTGRKHPKKKGRRYVH